MTITSARYVVSVLESEATNGNKSPKLPPQVWHAVDAPFKGHQAAPSKGYRQSNGDTTIVIDNGTEYRVRRSARQSADLIKVPVL